MMHNRSIQLERPCRFQPYPDGISSFSPAANLGAYHGKTASQQNLWLPRRGFIGGHGAVARAFTLIEMMVAVTLMTILIFGLLSMFYQTQRAAHLGTSQVDVMETGRSTIQFLTEEIEQITASGWPGVYNLIVTNPGRPDLVQQRPAGVPIATKLQDLFFLTRLNDEWIGTGYFIDPGGSLYRFEEHVPLTNVTLLYNDYLAAIDNLKTAPFGSLRRVADRIVGLQFFPYDTNGLLMTNYLTPKGDFVFMGNELPSSLDLQLAVLDPKAYEKYRTLTNIPKNALDYLSSNGFNHIHMFQRRIPVRSGL